jgi:hypothetical protein
MSPKIAPKLQKIIECHSNFILMKRIVKEAAVKPTTQSI